MIVVLALNLYTYIALKYFVISIIFDELSVFHLDYFYLEADMKLFVCKPFLEKSGELKRGLRKRLFLLPSVTPFAFMWLVI